MSSRSGLAAAAVSACIALATNANANLVTNGNFENTTLTAPGFAAGNLPGWNVTGPDYLWFPGTADQFPNPSANWGPGTGVNNGFPTTSPTGGNFLEQDPYYNAPLTQIITGLTPSATYRLSFYWAASTWTGAALAPTTRDWQVTLGSQTVTTASVILPAKGFQGWMHEVFYFTPSNPAALLSFLSQGTGDPPVALLDGVTLDRVDSGTGGTGAAPEPASWVLMIAGIGGAGAALRRRLTRTSGTAADS